MDVKYYARRKNRFLLQSAGWYALLIFLAYYFTELMLFYLVCGVYDVCRNSQLDAKLVYRYFFGNGVPTWALSPFNVLMDILTLPYLNKKVYQLNDLPADYREEIERLLAAVKSEKIVEQIAERAGSLKRSMLFFKWYGLNLDTSLTTPTFHQDLKYVKTIGVSTFNKQESTAEHFGPLRATLRVLYNINDIADRDAFIKVRNVENHWCENKLFIFDDTLSHQSFNQTTGMRYCLFVDIVRPSLCYPLMNFIVKQLGLLLQKVKFIFYGSWVPLT